MIKSFSGQVAFCFAILRAISAYVGENWLSQYMLKCHFTLLSYGFRHPLGCLQIKAGKNENFGIGYVCFEIVSSC